MYVWRTLQDDVWNELIREDIERGKQIDENY
jgi:hypothetical protein